MSRGHKGIRELVEATARSLGNSIQFTYGRTSDFDLIRDKKYPFITLDPMTANPEFAVDGVTNYSKTWSGLMAFYQLDHSASTPEQYALILDEMDVIVDQFIIKLNYFSYKSDKILVTFGQQQSFVKATADILTGFLLPINITPEDDFEYCENDINCVLIDEC